MIRPASPDDCENIAALLIQVWLHTYARKGLRGPISRYVLTEFTPEKIRTDIQDTNKLYLVAEIEKHIVGLALFEWSAPCPVTHLSMPTLHKLYVQEHFTGQGIGRKLLEEVIARCKTACADKLWLIVSPRNPRAVEFYNRHGFFHVGETVFPLEEERHENHVLHRVIR